ncbi:DUF202 domain-containing protein [Microbispora sp. ATCC PTA-5024]|uniref:DUF202 domain-containing protein n=1 Tax=Microbispora sp. ATCC PTA-5024 TaxID=316330 RepID=UPI0003DCD98B|nr:DUF202 domain-containing protein [Microbispora sp. ATCC PTA-5024]ETK32521.1 hypothetical protein MPTA5024_29270 [Microbispora sp. ATCC PTA-5024]
MTGPRARPGTPGGPGLHSERTRLAWVRAAAALAACGLGAAGAALRHGVAGAVTVPFVLAALSGAVLLVRTGVRHHHVERALAEGRTLDPGLDVRLAWLGALCVAAGALVLVITLAS